jgi:hypothetical protein
MVNPLPGSEIYFSKAARLVNPHQANSMLCGINEDMGMWPWIVKVNKGNIINIV